MDDRCHDVLTNLDLPNLDLIRLTDFEKGDHELLNAKNNRTDIEYYFTCTSSLPLYIFANWEQVDTITYLDSDLCFFSSPEPLFQEFGSGSVAIVGHNFPPHMKHLEKAGIYNVGWLTFRRSEQAFVCLRWWRNRCIEWCYDRFEEGKYADQKYLDEWPHRFPGVIVIRHRGANLAPWNLGNYEIEWDGHDVRVDGEPLIFFHFHGLKQRTRRIYDLNLITYEVVPRDVILSKIYEPYLRQLSLIQHELGVIACDSRSSPSLREADRAHLKVTSLVERCKGPFRTVRNLWWRRYVCVLGRRVFWH